MVTSCLWCWEFRCARGVREKILKFLKLNVGKGVAGEELAYLAGNRKEWARRIRELRTEHGWSVLTRQSGRPDMPIGAYMLEHTIQAEPHDRNIKDDVRVEVLERDKFACRKCGWTMKDVKRGDRRTFLELHHMQSHRSGGANASDNLIALCNVHHDAVHAKRLSIEDL